MENILFESQHPQAAIKLIDFGLSAEYTKAQNVLKVRVGTLYSMSPETMKGSYTTQADLWSIGVVAFTMLSGGQQPFEGKTPKQVVAAVLQGQYSLQPESAWESISDDAKEFVQNLLVVEPSERFNAQQAIRHPFIGQSHQFPKEFFKEGADEELKQRIRDGIVKYGQRSDFQRLALNVIAKKSSADEIFEIRKVFDEFDQENTSLDMGNLCRSSRTNSLLTQIPSSSKMTCLSCSRKWYVGYSPPVEKSKLFAGRSLIPSIFSGY